MFIRIICDDTYSNNSTNCAKMTYVNCAGTKTRTELGQELDWSDSSPLNVLSIWHLIFNTQCTYQFNSINY